MTDDSKIDQVLEMVRAVKESVSALQSVMLTKEDAKVFATKADLQETESRLMSHIDGLAMRTEKFDHELVAAQAKFNRLEERIEVVEIKVGIAA